MDKEMLAAFMLAAIVIALLVSCYAMLMKNSDLREELKQTRAQAVRHKYAKYINDDYGVSSFSWIIPAEAKQELSDAK